MNDKYELSADDFAIIRKALRAHLDTLREEHSKKYWDIRFPGSVELTPESQKSATEWVDTESLIDKFDNAENAWLEEETA